MKHLKYYIIVFHTFIVLNLIPNVGSRSASECMQKETCGSCIQMSGCAWCAVPLDQKTTNDGDLITRCVSEQNQPPNWCPEGQIINPKSQSLILEDKKLSAGDLEGNDAVQIRPQKIKVVLRKGEHVKIPIKYQQAVDYPVDLYYLMDLSASMADDKDSLSALGQKLSTTMNNITNNFRLGFGAFVDKPTMPYANTHPDMLKKPCNVGQTSIPCDPPYSFRNHMRLSSNSTLFSQKVKDARVSGNMDHPEGGLEALMQVMVCSEEIGWREKSRKMLILSTDAGFHMAGDGKLGGIVEPNDEQCHLDKTGMYTHSLIMDYPSVSQIDKKVREKNINIIFAVTKNEEKIYNALKTQIHSASCGILSKASSNVVDFVKSEYMKIVDSVQLTDNAGGAVEIQYYSKCLESAEKQRNECGKLKGRPVVDFTAVIKAVDCPENKNQWNQKIEIKPSALSEKLEIDLQIICQCDCEQAGNAGFEKNSKSCNTSGNLQCGICSCNQGRYGRFCECDGDEVRLSSADLSKCKASNETDEICSNLGTCKCNKCDCNKRTNTEEIIYGTYCECDNFSCKRSGGLLCSGPDNGRCDCGKCICQSGWSGPACECRDTNITCTAPNSEEVCSNHGSCVCGACQCSMTEKFRYSGKYCEECPHCSSTRCDELRHCVECQVHKSGLYDSTECKLKCIGFESEVVDTFDNIDSDTDEGILENEKLCRVPDNSGCTIVFKYGYQDDNISLKVVAQKNKECSNEIDILAVVCSVVGSVVLAGIIILIFWKVATNIHDKREFIKFEKERLMAKWDRGDNPLYKPSTSTFNNPAFGQRMSGIM